MKTFAIFTVLLLFSSASAQHNWQVTVSGGVISPGFLLVSPFGNQFDGIVYYNFSETQISISSGLHNWEVEYGPGGNRFTAIPVLAGGRYLVEMDYYTFYLSGELGFHIINREFTREIYDRSDFIARLISSEPDEESVTKFAYRVGVGASIRPLDNIEFDFSIRYNGISYSFVTDYLNNRTNFGLLYYSFMAGISFLF
jgi:opacity protein-like surface antigen